jgi:hypothetical protein
MGVRLPELDDEPARSQKLSSDFCDILMPLGTFEADETATRTVGAEVETALPAEPHHQLSLAAEVARW